MKSCRMRGTPLTYHIPPWYPPSFTHTAAFYTACMQMKEKERGIDKNPYHVVNSQRLTMTPWGPDRPTPYPKMIHPPSPSMAHGPDFSFK
ncbi:hypothetical protein CGRA01v4_02803 [Colletotrichum graminicola]|nr:hypothetical protein CGRA01v4_02803 [Colletotrichum graminicola]